MKKIVFLCSIIGSSLFVGGCFGGGPTTGTQQGTVMSCFDGSKTGALTCVDTPSGPVTQGEDVDNDGKDDTFVCADRDSDDDGTPDFEDSHDDSASHDSGTASGSGSDDGSGTASGDSSGHDSDGDGIDDDHDCGNGAGSGSGSAQPPV